MSKSKLRVGVVGCGNISKTYFDLSQLFKGFEIAACADLNADLAKSRAETYGIRALAPKQLIADPDVDVVLNLTVPSAHFGVSAAALRAGKHVYSEKPLTLNSKEAMTLAALAKEKRRMVCAAPDTFLGGAHQQARALIDSGKLRKVAAGTAFIMSHGMEHWHPNPDFFFKPGGGPVLDMGPYYIACLINLIGPVKRVAALTSMASRTRLISSQPRAGEKIAVKTPTNIHALLEFASGASVTLAASWDVWSHEHNLMEIYGTEGTLYLPDPNFFGGENRVTARDGKPEALKPWAHPFGIANQTTGDGERVANYRAAGLADMADAILSKRDPRCSIARALHTVEVMTAILTSGESGRFVDIKSKCTRPAALGPDEAAALLK